jgi:hypothetical protein
LPPRTVLPQLQEVIQEAGMNYLLCIFSFGNLAPKTVLHSLELFSREVMPKL